MDHYSTICKSHPTSLPETFNFGRDVVDNMAQYMDKIALIWCNDRNTERVLTFQDIADSSNQVANWLVEQDVSRGDRIIVMLPRIPEWQICLTACLKLGAVPIPCITMLTEKDVAFRMDHSGAAAVITTGAETAKFQTYLPTLKAGLAIGGAVAGWADYGLISDQDKRFECCDLGLEEPAIMYYTSGSTGDPKGVCHPTRSLYAWRYSAVHWLSLEPSDIMWCTADTGWSKAGTSILFGPWSQGSTVLIYDGPFEPRRRFELIERYRVSVFCAAATELRQLIKQDIVESTFLT